MKYLIGSILLLCCSLAMAQDKPAGRFSGYMFGDYYYNLARDGAFNSFANTQASSGAAPGGTAMQAFQFRRVYFTYDNDISDHFTSRFRLEVDQVALSSDGKTSVFVKDAFLRWKNIFSGSDLIFGIQPTPTFEISEAAWGYRSLEKTIMDLRGIAPSRDLGITLKGKLIESGSLNYWILIADGTGNRPETDKYKRYYGHIQFSLMQNLQLTANVDYTDRANTANPYQAGSTVENGTTTYSLFAGFKESGKFNIGGEGYLQSTANGFNNGTSLASRSGVGFSVFGSLNLQDNLAVVARFDSFDPNNDSNAKGDSRSYFLGGVSWKADKNVSIIPNILLESYENNPNGTSYTTSLTARVTFYYVFL